MTGTKRRTRSAFFEAWRGRYADSPRSISERLHERHPELEHVWVADPGTALPEGVTRVRRHSAEYFRRLLTADFIVANDIISKHLVKGPRAVYVQTWHGTPLKTIGWDEVIPAYKGAAAHRKRMVRDVRKWDHLISPSPACTSLFRSAFRFDGEIIETGYPRNDVLMSPDAQQIRDEVRSQLGLSPTATAVLYAPTWRDDVRADDGSFMDTGSFDTGEFLANSADDTVVLMRMHKLVASRTRPDDAGRVLDVSDHDDITELYLAADVLISDYSSAVYDFAVTRKPIVLYAYDLDHYRSSLRKLYFDYESWAPGPIVTTTVEAAEAVASLVAAEDRRHAWSDRYDEFVDEFCPLEDGSASDRVIDRVFEPVLGRATRGRIG